MSPGCGSTSWTPIDRCMACHMKIKIVYGQKNRITPVRQAQADTIRERFWERGSGAAGRWVHHRAARQNKDERKKHQEWKARVGYNSKWMVKIIIYSFKRLLGKALRAVKPEYIMIDIATKITVYDKTRDVMRKATG